MINITNLSFSFRDNLIFSNFSLEVKKNEKVALLGSSGKGKTTLFRLITGWHKPDSGTISVGNDVALMTQEETLLPWKTVLGNLLSFSKDRGKALMLLEKAGLNEVAKAYPQSLSKGMRQRVIFLRAILSGKPLLLLDEPFSALDQDTKRQMMALLHSYEGTILMITHDEREAKELGCRIVNL